MTTKYQKVMHMWGDLAPKFLPFADAASEDLPLSRLLRLALFQVSVGMALVLLVGTLNRVMIVELRVPSSIVSIMVAIPLLFAPFRALIGFRSDNHRSELGWRRSVCRATALGGSVGCSHCIFDGGCRFAHHPNRGLGVGQ